MPGLLDISPSVATVAVNGVDVSVTGVSAKGIATLLGRFPAIREMFAGRVADLSAEKIFELVPDAIAAIIAAGTGYPGNPEAEAKAESLPVGVQADIIQAIIDVTMPKGVGPFMEQIAAVVGVVNGGPISIPDGKSPLPSNP